MDYYNNKRKRKWENVITGFSVDENAPNHIPIYPRIGLLLFLTKLNWLWWILIAQEQYIQNKRNTNV